MRHFKTFAFVAISFLFSALGTHYAAAGVILNGTISAQTAEVRDLVAADPTTMYAATQGGGLWKSTTSGVSWIAVASMPARYVWKIAIAPTSGTVYVATTTGLYRSTDGGVSWSQRTVDAARALAIDPTDASGNTILVGVSGAGILRSVDGGATFADLSQGLDSTDIRAIVYDANGNAYAALFGNSNGGGWGGVFKLIRPATAWTNWNNAGTGTAIENKFVTSLAVSSSVLLAGTQDPNSGDGKVHRSFLSGGGWINPTTEGAGWLFGVESLAYDRSGAGGGNAFYAGSRALCSYRSIDGGVTWARQAQLVAANTEVCANIYALGTLPNPATNVVVAAKGAGLFYTTAPSTSATWTRATGLTADRIRAFAPSPTVSTYFAGLEGGGVMRTLNGGASWTSTNTGFLSSNGLTPQLFTINAFVTHPTDTSQVFAGARGPGLYQLAGTTWSLISDANLPGVGDLKPQAIQFDSSGTNLYYTLFDSGQGIYRRSGSGWSLMKPGVWGGAGAAKVVTLLSGALLALMYDDLPQRSANGGGAWSVVNAMDSGFTRLAFVGVTENPLVSGQMLAASNKGIFRSLDDGSNWVRVPVSGALRQTTLSAILFAPNSSTLVFAADRGGNFYCSIDTGQTWSLAATVAAPITTLRNQSNEIWAITDGAGVVRMNTSCP